MLKYFLLSLLVLLYVVRLTYKRCRYVMYGRSSCPHCVHMKRQLNEDGAMKDFRYIEITTRNGRREFEKDAGGESVGVPLFVNKHTGKRIVGSRDTSSLLMDLEDANIGDVVMYGSMGCGYTVKMIDELKKNNAWDAVTFVDVDTPDGKELYDQLGVNGVPYMVHSNGRDAHGYMPFDELMKRFGLI